VKYFILFVFAFFTFSTQAFSQETQVERKSPVYSEGTLMKPKVELFPIPATEYLYVDVGADSISVVSFELYNLIGSKMPVYAEKVEGGVYRIDVRDLYQGQYMLIIKDPKKPYNRTYKFTKKESFE
jgi:hypothetical protein